MVFDMKEIDTVKFENNNRVIRFNNEEKSILSFSWSSSVIMIFVGESKSFYIRQLFN